MYKILDFRLNSMIDNRKHFSGCQCPLESNEVRSPSGDRLQVLGVTVDQLTSGKVVRLSSIETPNTVGERKNLNGERFNTDTNEG